MTTDVKGDPLWWGRDELTSTGRWVYPLVVPACAPGTPPERDMREMAAWWNMVQLSQAGVLFWMRSNGEVCLVRKDDEGR